MSTPFLERILQFYEEDPHDPFNVYALALEYMKFDGEKAVQYFDELLSKHPDYLPTYYHAAQLYGALEQHDKAVHTYEEGIKLAIQLNNNKTLTELQRAYQMYQDEQEDW